MGADKRTAPAPEARGRGRDSCESATDLETTSSSTVDLEPTYAIATPQGDGPSERWDPGTITFAEYVQRAENPADRKQCGGLLAGTLAGGRKRREDVLTRSMATLDADDAEPGLLEAVRGLGVQALLHSTWRHTLEAPRYRVVLPYRREVTAVEHAHVSRALMSALGLEQFDPRSAYPEQFMYWPATSDPEQYVHEVIDGPLLDPDQYLARPLPEVPSQRQQEPVERLRTAPTAPASPRARAYVEQAVRGALEELEQTAAMPEGARDGRGRGWESGGARGGGLLHAHACRLVELSNRAPEGYPLEQAEQDYLRRAPAGEHRRFARHWSSALEHVGERAAEIPEEEDYSGMTIQLIDDRAPAHEEEPGLSHVDLSALLTDGKLPDPPRTSILHRTDGASLFYRGRVNRLFGDPESGKSWVLLAAAAEVLESGGTVVHLDLDHMDRAELVRRLAMLGTPLTVLGDPSRFRLYQPAEGPDLDRAVAESVRWRPDLVGLDSLGEVLPMFGLSSNSPDDYTAAHRRAVQPLADAGAAVVVIDHLAKAADSRGKGPGGTLAKGRPIRGASLRVATVRQFAPGQGGACRLTIDKDTAGGLRASCPPKGRSAEPQAGVFTLSQRSDGTLDWYIEAPRDEQAELPEVIDGAALEAVSKALEAEGPLSKNKTIKAVNLRGEKVPEVLAQLERGGYIRQFRHGAAHMAESVKPYRDGDPLDGSTDAEGEPSQGAGSTR